MYEVRIDMKNQNALAALAYIKTCDNPIEIFCNYTKYALSLTPDKSLCADDIHKKIYDKFGLDMSYQMITMALKILKKKKAVEYIQDKKSYRIIDNSFDLKKFDETFKRLHTQEKQVVDFLIKYINDEYSESWSYDEASRNLSYFLREQGNGTKLFIDEKPSYENKLSPSWYIGRAIDFLSKNREKSEWEYLVDIVNGMMIYHGVYETNDYQQDKEQKFKGTCFYFDTKLVLRAMGFSTETNIQMVREFVELIKNDYEGKICVFDKTISEIKIALNSAGDAFERGERIYDNELRLYAELNPTGAELFKERASAVKKYLTDVLNFELEPYINWTADENRRFFIDKEELKKYLEDKNPEWKKGAIQNDVSVINQVNILRRGDYSIRYGGKGKLPVFVTTNSFLVYSVKEYAAEQCKRDVSTFWDANALPVVSDNMVLYRLWLPLARKHRNLPALTLSRYAHCAQNVDEAFFEILREKLLIYKNENGIDVIDLDDARRIKLENIIVEKTEGDPENITEEVLSKSLDELVLIETLDVHEQLLESQAKGKHDEGVIEKQRERIINLAAKPYYNKIGWRRGLVYLFQHLGIIISAILLLLSSIVSTSIDIDNININNFLYWLIVAFPTIIEVLIYGVDRVQNCKKYELLFTKKIVKYVYKKYVEKIIKSVANDEQAYLPEIIEKCVINTPIFFKYKEDVDFM